MTKNIILAALIPLLLIFGIIYYAERKTETPETEKEFYTREDLKNIEPHPGTASVYYMWMKGCPVCAALDEWFKEMKYNYSIKVYKFDVARESALFSDVLEAYGVPAEKRGFVPFVFIGNEYFVGFDQQIAADMEKSIRECLGGAECINPYDKLSK